MKISKQSLKALLFLFVGSLSIKAQNPEPTIIDINLDVNHVVGSEDSFDRRKFITVHGSPNERDWILPGMEPLTEYLINDLDVYFGRDNGTLGSKARGNQPDATRPGYADPVFTTALADLYIDQYAAREQWHKFDTHTDVMMGGQYSGFWPLYGPGTYKWAGPEAVGEWFANWVSNAYRAEGDPDINNGFPMNRFLEILNEPLYHFVDDPNTAPEEKATPLEVFEFHRDVAKEFHLVNTSTSKIGGYTEAFPEFDYGNFDEWDERMKLFMDVAGEEMDFYSLHFYDFNQRYDDPNHRHYKGGRLEAHFDMVENYSMLLEGNVKPMVISEYGGRDLRIEGQSWSRERDWIFMKAFTPLLMQFMDRPHLIEKAIPFIPGNYHWTLNPAFGNGEPYTWRLTRQENEPDEASGDYVFTEFIKFYELWANVGGKRIDTWSSNEDVLVDAYVDGDKAYLILSNLSFDAQEINLNVLGENSNTIQNIKLKHLHAVNAFPLLDETNGTSLSSFTLDPEASAVIEYTYNSNITIDQTSVETKYYGDKVKEAIVANTPISIAIDGVNVETNNESILRVSYGRDRTLSQEPTIVVNGTTLAFNAEYAGDTEQPGWDGVFMTLDVVVPQSVIQTNNVVEITFPDAGGFVSSVTLRSYNFSRPVSRSNDLTGITISPDAVDLGVGQERQLIPIFNPIDASDRRVLWSSSNGNVSVTQDGKITGEVVGSSVITVTALDGSFTDDITVNVQASYVDVLVEDIEIVSESDWVYMTFELPLAVNVLPVDADDTSVTWSSNNESIATVNPVTGVVTPVSDGNVTIKATANDASGVEQTIDITVLPYTPAFLLLDDAAKYLAPNEFHMGETLDITMDFDAGSGNVVNSTGVKFFLRWMQPNWTVVKDFTAYDRSIAGQQSGTATASIDLSELQYTSEELDVAGHFYFIFALFADDKGHTTYINENEVGGGQGEFPIQIIADPTASVDEDAILVSSIIYPNPVVDVLNINTTELYEELSIYNSAGILVDRLEEPSGQYNMSNYASGIYFVELKGKGNVKTLRTRIVKE